MPLWRMVLKELLHRKLSFASGFLSVAIAVGCVSGAMSLLAAHDLRTEEVITRKEAETRESMRRMEDDYRRIMRDMGYNVLILHKDQDPAALQRGELPDVYMPDDYAQRLADGGISTLNHLLPVLQRRLFWEEHNIEVVVAGVRGQVSMTQRKREGGVGPDGTPIMEPVPHGTVDVGYALAERFGLDSDAKLILNGITLTVNKRLPRRGAQEDITLWVHLNQAQEWFALPGKINGIFALECICNADALGAIVSEVRHILPDVQVFEFSSMVQTRAQARERAAEAHREAIASERDNRMNLRHERQQMGTLLASLVIAGALVWVFLLTLTNVRERRYEIGIVRALGFSAFKIIGLFQMRAIVMAMIGAFIGYIGGVFAGAFFGGGAALLLPVVVDVLRPSFLLGAMVAATVLACVASWLPALKAAAQDPAEILREMT